MMGSKTKLQASTNDMQPWTGCDWETEFGPLKLNLQGIRSCQALLAASATRGEEAQQWRDAAKWLQKLEADARQASELRLMADQAERAGRSGDVASLRNAAASIEQRYLGRNRHPNRIFAAERQVEF
ncbi:hypothetical protein [Roseiconus lacunae]